MLASPIAGNVLPAPDRAPQRNALAWFWTQMMRGRLRVWLASETSTRSILVARATMADASLSDCDASMVTRTLCGEPQKAMASDFGVAVSTVSVHTARALEGLGVARRRVPLPLVLAAQSFAGRVSISSARSRIFAHHGVLCVAVGVARPITAPFTTMSPSEQEVARKLIEGHSRFEIVNHRGTSPATVGIQLCSVYSALGVSGRPSLILRAAELGCFDGS